MFNCSGSCPRVNVWLWFELIRQEFGMQYHGCIDILVLFIPDLRTNTASLASLRFSVLIQALFSLESNSVYLFRLAAVFHQF